MIKYRIFSKETIVDKMDQEEAATCIEILRQNNPDIIYDIEEYNWSHDGHRLGRDPDLH
jgi:hypothetical protein